MYFSAKNQRTTESCDLYFGIRLISLCCNGKECLLKEVTIQDIPKERHVFDLKDIRSLSPNLKILGVLKFSSLNSRVFVNRVICSDPAFHEASSLVHEKLS